MLLQIFLLWGRTTCSAIAMFRSCRTTPYNIGEPYRLQHNRELRTSAVEQPPLSTDRVWRQGGGMVVTLVPHSKKRLGSDS